MQKHYCRLLIGAALAVLTCGQAQPDIIYRNNFETNTAGFSNGGTTVLPTDGSRIDNPTPGATSTFLGQFTDNNATTLSLGGLIPGNIYEVEFDLFIGRSWDGNSTAFGATGDQWRLTTDALPGVLVDTTFINLVPTDGFLNNFTQNYSDATPTGPGAFPAFTGADVARTNVQEPDFLQRYAIYSFGHGAPTNPTLTFTATGTTANLTFASLGLDNNAADEFWAIDNVVVQDFAQTAAVPEPSTYAMMFLGLGMFVVMQRRKKLQAKTNRQPVTA